MTLVSGGRSKERVLAFGMEGTGKSLLILDVAARVHPNRVHIIDNDNAWDRMLEGPTLDEVEVGVAAEYRWRADGRGGGGFEFDDRWVTEGGNVIVYHVDGWEGHKQAIAEIRLDAQPDDWAAIDSGSAPWDDVSDWYVDKVFGQSKADFFLTARLAMEKNETGGLDGWKDYSVINAEYREHIMAFLITPPCHLLVTAEQAEITSGQIKGKDIEDREVKAMYGGIGYKARGQKRMGHNMQTVLQLRRGARGDYSVYTVKDRGGREFWKGQDVTGRGFGDWYLEETAGWVEKATPDSTSPTAPTPKAKGTIAPKAKG